MKALIGKKIGMTQIFDEESGQKSAVTVLDVSNNVVAGIIKDGEKVSHLEIGKDRQKNPSKPDLGNYKTLKFVPQNKVMLKVDEEGEAKIGDELKAEVFEKGDGVDVTGISKGKGFQGVMKRWGFKGGKRTHGQSDRERAPGSIGSGTTPGRVFKGKKMAGHMGNSRVTVQNLEISHVDSKNNLISVSGSIPGANGSYVVIKEQRTKNKGQITNNK